MSEILQNGKTIQTNGMATIELKGDVLQLMLDAHRNGKPFYLKFGYEESFIPILGKEISTGPMGQNRMWFAKIYRRKIRGRY